MATNAAEENRLGEESTTFDTVSGVSAFGRRPYLPKEGREIANNAARKMAVEQPEFVEDPKDVTMAEVLKFMSGDGGHTERETATLCDLLTKGLDFREAVVWFLWEHAGLDMREIYHVDEGKERSDWGEEQEIQGMRNIRSGIKSAANKLGHEVELPLPGDDD